MNPVLLLVMACSMLQNPNASKISPVFRASSKQTSTFDLVLENEYLRVYRETIPPHSESDVRQNGKNDFVEISLSTDDVPIPAGSQGAESEHFSSSIVAFHPGGSPEKIANSGDQPSVRLIVEFKRHWDSPMRRCTAPRICVHREDGISETESIFTNGFLTASRHWVTRGGTLSSSYYSAKGLNHILFVPLDPLQANFGGIDKQLPAGQPYFSDATQVDVTGEKGEARWIVLRLNTPN